ncbi:hypothetical protein C365_06461 [Cryptococcus neoformans Bt85]|nr:hypothetical protein C365_06461 [Cryptococcus neoformans var. grubii Bt85]
MRETPPREIIPRNYHKPRRTPPRRNTTNSPPGYSLGAVRETSRQSLRREIHSSLFTPHSSTPMFGAIVNRPNHVQAKQIAYQAEKVPVYLRGNGKYYYRAYLAFLGVSFVGAHFQLFQYMRGKANKNE